MRLEGLITLLFIFYCIAAGLLLILAPWGPLWERILMLAPKGVATQILAHSAARSAASGFGLVHLVWALNDLEGLLILPKAYGTDDVP